MKKDLRLKLCTLFLFCFCYFNNLIGQDCSFSIEADVQHPTCMNDGIITIRVDTVGKKMSDLRYSLVPLVAGASQAEDNVLTGIPGGTYKVVVDAMCSASGSPIAVSDTLRDVKVDTVYTIPSFELVSGLYASGHQYGTVPSFSCAATGKVQLNLQGGVFPYTVDVYKDNIFFKQVVFDTIYNTANNSSSFFYKHYYTIEDLAPGNYSFTVTDGCNYEIPLPSTEVPGIAEPFPIESMFMYRGPSNTGITNDLIVRYELLYYTSKYPDYYYYYNTHNSGSQVWWEYAISTDNQATWSAWKDINQRGTNQDTLNNYCSLYGSKLFIKVRTKACTDEIVTSFDFKNPQTNTAQTSNIWTTDSTITIPERYDACGCMDSFERQYQSMSALRIKSGYDNTSRNGVLIYGDMYFMPPLRMEVKDLIGDTLMYNLTQDTPSLGWSFDIPIQEEDSLRGIKITVYDKNNCQIYTSSSYKLTYKAQTYNTGGNYWPYSFMTGQGKGNICNTEQRYLAIYKRSDCKFSRDTTKNYANGNIIKLIESPDNNSYSFTATFSTADNAWNFADINVPEGTTLDHEFNGANNTIYMRKDDLPAGTYVFETTTDCKVDTISVNYVPSDALSVSERPAYNVIKGCSYMNVVPVAGQIKIADRDTTTVFRVISGPSGGYNPVDYNLNDSIRLTMTGTYQLRMYFPSQNCAYVDTTIVYANDPLQYDYLHAYVCSQADLTAKLKVLGKDGSIPYFYTVYSQYDAQGEVLGSGALTNYNPINAKFGDKISVKVQDLCNASFISNITVINLEQTRKAWFKNNDSQSLAVCQGQNVQLEGLALGDITYSWTGPNSFSSDLRETSFVADNVNQSGKYYLEIGDSHCDGVIDSVSLQVNALPTATLSGGGIVCAGQTPQLSITLTGIAPWTIVTSNNQTLIINDGDVVNDVYTWTPSTVITSYSLTSVNDANCTGTVSGTAAVTYTALPSASFAGNVSVCSGSQAQLQINMTGTAPYSITYNVQGSDVVVNNIQTDTYTIDVAPATTSTYTLNSITDANCSSILSASATVTVNPLPTAVLSGSDTICNNMGNGLNIALTGTEPWSVVTSNGETLNIYATNLNGGVYTWIPNPLPAIDTQYSLISVADGNCQGTARGLGTVTIGTSPQFIACPLNIDTATIANECYRNLNYTVNAVGEPAPQLIYEFTGATSGSGTGSGSGSTFNKGITYVTISAINLCDTIECNFEINVKDRQSPSVSCQSAYNLTTDTGKNYHTINGTIVDPLSFFDNCPNVLLTNNYNNSTSLAGVQFPIDTTYVKWTVADASGNEASCTSTIVVLDVEPPCIGCEDPDPSVTEISCITIGDQNKNTDLEKNTYTHGDDLWNVTAIDNDSVVSIVYTLSGVTTGTGTSLNGVAFNIGATTVQWVATDRSNNTDTCTFIVTVVDNEPPCIGCEDPDPDVEEISCITIGDQSKNTDLQKNTYTHNDDLWNVTAIDNDSVVSTVYTLSGVTTGTGTSLNGVAFNIGSTTVQWVATDRSNNTDTCTFIVTVVDNEPPCIGCEDPDPDVEEISCITIGDQNKNTDLEKNTYTHSDDLWNVTAIDNDSVVSIVYTLSGVTTGTGTSLNGVAFNIGATTVQWIATDRSNNTDTCTFIVTVVDNEPPCIGCEDPDPDVEEISCITIGDQNKNTDLEKNTYTHSDDLWNVTAIDNDSVVSIVYTLSGVTTGTGTSLNGVAFNIGATTVQWVATDKSNNTDTCTFIVTVVDNEPPCIGCEDPDPDVEEISCITIGDQNKNTDLEKNTYTHNDDLWNVTAIDNDSVVSIVYTLSGVTTGTGTSLNGVAFNIGSTTVQWVATDRSNNTDTCTFIVTVVDNEPPCIGCEDPDPDVEEISCITIGDQNKNTDLQKNTYTHNDDLWNVTAIDNDSVVSIVYTLSGVTTGTGTSLNGVAFNIGATTVQWVATDRSNNTDTCTFIVTVVDNEPPCIGCEDPDPDVEEISCITIGDQSKNTDPDVNTYTHNDDLWNVTAIDNDSVVSIVYTLSGVTTGTGTSLNGVAFNIGATTAQWVATDRSNNTDTCTFIVTVVDNEPPCIGCEDPDPDVEEISCITIGDQSKNTDLEKNTYTHGDDLWNVTAVDNDSVVSIVYTLSGVTTGTGTSLNGVVFNIGSTTVQWVATDRSNNTDTCTFIVTVVDNEPPCIGCEDPDPDVEEISCITIGDQSKNTDPDVNTYTHGDDLWNVTAVDNDSVASIVYTLSGVTTGTGTSLNGVAFNIGATTVQWVATDRSNNTDTCTFIVTVVDNEPPCIGCEDPDPDVEEISCITIGDQSKNTDLEKNTYTHNDDLWNVTAIDNDSVVSIVYTLSGVTTGTGTSLNGVAFNIGSTTVQWIATDRSNNTDTCTFIVTVVDNEPPCIGCEDPDPDVEEISCITIGDQSKTTDLEKNTYTHNDDLWNVTAIDNDSVVSIVYTLSGVTTGTGTSLNGVAFNIGATTVQWVATDRSNNTDTCTFVVTVVDNEPPCIGCEDPDPDVEEISCITIGDQSKNTDPDVNTYTHGDDLWNVTAIDNDSVASIVYTLSGVTTGTGTSLNGVAFNIGSTTVQWVATDKSNNTDTCTFIVTVVDNEPPCIGCEDPDPSVEEISCESIGNQSFCLNGETTYIHGDNSWNVTATDNDSVVSIVYTLSGATTGTGTSLNGVEFNVGTTTIQWVATDRSNNTDTCTFTVEIHQAPVINVTSMTYCHGENVPAYLLGDEENITYSWEFQIGNSIGLSATSGGNEIPAFAAENNGMFPQFAVYKVVATHNLSSVCPTSEKMFLITVNPTPALAAIEDKTYCNGTVVSEQTLTGTAPLANYVWMHESGDMIQGIPQNGITKLPAFNAINNGSTVLSGVYKATADYTYNNRTCNNGDTLRFSITVMPTPTVEISVADQTVCSGAELTEIAFTGVDGGTFQWVRTSGNVDGLPASGYGNIPAQTLQNNDHAAQTATYLVTPEINANGIKCSGTAKTFTVTVLPQAAFNTIPDFTYCQGEHTNEYAFGNTAGVAYSWQKVSGDNTGLIESGNGPIPSFTAINTGSTTLTATYEVIATYTTNNIACSSDTTFTVTVNPYPVVEPLASMTVCNNSPLTVPLNGNANEYRWKYLRGDDVGLPMQGSGADMSFSDVYVDATQPVTATYSITPVIVNGTHECIGESIELVLTVVPQPLLTSVMDAGEICSGETFEYTASCAHDGVAYEWSCSPVEHINNGESRSGTSNVINHVLVNTSAEAVPYVYEFRLSAAGCTSPQVQQITLMINPTPTLDMPATMDVCPGITELPIQYTTASTADYKISFSQEARLAGFVDVADYTNITDGQFNIQVPGIISKGIYPAQLSLSNGSCESSYAFDIQVQETGSITQQPEAMDNVCTDSDVSLYVGTTGNVTYQWFYNGEAVSGETYNTFYRAASDEWYGNYYAIVTDNCGNEIKSAEVSVTVNPAIVEVKWDNVMYVRDPEHIFTTFQWYKNSMPIAIDGYAPYYGEEFGLNGTYYVRCYYADNTYVESCPVTFTSETNGVTRMYSNPAKTASVVYIEIDTKEFNTENAIIEVFSADGKFISHHNVTGTLTQIIAPNAAGTYVIRIISASNDIIVKQLVVK